MKKIDAECVANSIMERTPELYNIPGYNQKWSYDYEVVLKGFEKLWKQTRNVKYLHFIESNLEPFIEDDGSINRYREDDYNIDNINNGKLLFLLYKETGKEKYKKAMDRLRSQLTHHPRTSEGAFWHKKVYPYQIWLDGLYMATPFYAEYQLTFEDGEGLQDIVTQFKISYKNLKDPNTGLLYHAWDEKRVQKWANKETGHSPNFWGRSLGWYVMALVDTIELLPKDYEGRKDLVFILKEVLQALIKFQDSKTGLWYQVVNKGTEKGNYLEASASSMITYAIKKGCNLNLFPSAWEEQAEKSKEGLIDEFVLLTKDGWVNLNKNCQVAGLSDDRDGSYTYYISEPIICNDLKGVGAFLQALTEFNEGAFKE
ncbi:glycoside hydrolase family 88/105 protein [Fredinandcohnia onubensis]|uniref:glycoside hydrolase family 88/105 protein n=1 Tax=Fredinandcohnia onubensis TaxID=1571209 RepID=UPI001FE944B0|nr:glycoside hydrolase family 88 protein [Fredinandcohnia onubensis]